MPERFCASHAARLQRRWRRSAPRRRWRVCSPGSTRSGRSCGRVWCKRKREWVSCLPRARRSTTPASEERDVGDMRVPLPSSISHEGDPEQAIEVLAPVLDGSAPVLHRPSTLTEAQLLDAVAREQLGDQRAAEASLERALDLAEPEGVLLPFILVPVRAAARSPVRAAHRTSGASASRPRRAGRFRTARPSAGRKPRRAQ